MRSLNSLFPKIGGLRCAVPSVAAVVLVAIFVGSSHAQDTGPTPIPTESVVAASEGGPAPATNLPVGPVKK